MVNQATSMALNTTPLPSFLAEPTKIGQEISVTGKWIPKKKGGIFRKSVESKEMLKEWEDIHAGAKADTGVLSTEINHAVGEDAVLIHHTFKSPQALLDYFSTTATQHMKALHEVAIPELHFIRGTDIPTAVKEALLAKHVPAVFGEFPLFDADNFRIYYFNFGTCLASLTYLSHIFDSR